MSPKEFVALVRAEGFDFFTGVPCSLVKGVIAELETTGAYIPETREDAALGLAAGAYLGGKRPLVVMQNSGLGVSLNAIASLNLMYRLPCLILVTWRGYEGKDAPEHIVMGAACDRLMGDIGLPFRIPEANTVAPAVRWAVERIERERLPAALLVRKGVLG